MTIRIPIPQAALTRIPHQHLKVSDLQSCQQSFRWAVRNFTDTAAYLATPGNDYYVEITDANNILPYTTTRFNISDTPQNPALWDPFAGDLWLTAADTTPALAAATLAAQINLFAQLMVGRKYPAFKSMRARSTATEVEFYMPWGMLGAPSTATDGPDPAPIIDLEPGVDNPLWFSLLGPRRHCMRIIPTYPGPYYGDPIG